MLPLCIIALPLVAAPQEATSTRTYDLRSILASSAHERDVAPMDWQLPSIDEIYSDEEVSDPDEELGVDLEECLAIVRDVVGATPGAAVEALVDEEDRFIITANDAAHGAISAALQSVEEEAVARVVVELFRVDPALLGEDRSAVLSSESAAALSASAPDAERTMGHVQLGRLTLVGHETTVQYLQDYDVEVAQFSAVIDPTVNRVHLGLRARVRVDRSHEGDRLIVRVRGRNSSMDEEMRRVALQAYGETVIEHPVVDAAQFAASAKLEQGGALVIDPGHPDGEVLVVRCIADLAPRAEADPMVDFGWLLAPPHRPDPVELPVVNPSRGLDPGDGSLSVSTLPWVWQRPDEFRLVSRLLGDDTRARSNRVGAGAIVACDAEDRRRLRARIAARAGGDRARTLEIRSAHMDVDGAELARAMTDASYLAGLCEAAAVQRSGSVFAEDTLALAGGRLTSQIQDIDVQVAQAAVAGDPIVKCLLDGGALWCSPVRVSADRLLIWFDAAHQEGSEDLRRLDMFLSSPAIAGVSGEVQADNFEKFVLTLPLDLASTRSIHGRALLDLEPDRWTILAAQPYEADGRVQLIAVKARAAAR